MKTTFTQTTVTFDINASSKVYYLDDLEISVLWEEKTKKMADKSYRQHVIGYHLGFDLTWQNFKKYSGDVEEDNIYLLSKLRNPSDTVKIVLGTEDYEVFLPGSTDQILSIRNNIRQGTFALDLRTKEMLTDPTTLDSIKTLGYQLNL